MKQVIALLASVFVADAATYYVDNAGSDGAAGTSPATAWQTLSKVNGESFSAGDSVLLKSGGTWYERLVFPSSGSAGNPITIGAYSTGSQPVISALATTAVTGFAREAAGNYVFAQDYATNDSTTVFGDASTTYGGEAGLTPAATHTITQVDFMLASITGSLTGKNFTVEVYTMSGTSLNTLVGSSDNVAGASITVNTWTPATFSTPATITAGTPYAIVLTMSGIDGINHPTMKISTAHTLGGTFNHWRSNKTQLDVKSGESASFRLYESNATPPVWSATLTPQPTTVLVFGYMGTKVPSKASVAASNQWFWASNDLTVYSTVDPSGSVIPAVLDYPVNLGSHANLTLDGLTVLGNTNTDNAVGSIRCQSGSNITIQNCTVKNSSGNGIALISVTGSTISNCVVALNSADGIRQRTAVSQVFSNQTVINCTVVSNLNIGVEVTGANASGNRITNVTVLNNNLSHNGVGTYLTWVDNALISSNLCSYDSQTGDTGGIECESLSNSIIEHNEVSHCLNQGIQLYGSAAVNSSTNNIVRYNFIHDNTDGAGYGINLNTVDPADGVNSNQIYYNLITGNTHGVYSVGTFAGNTLYNNVLYGNANGLTMLVAAPGLTVKNNLFGENSTLDINATTTTTLTHSNNSFYRAAGGNRVLFNGVTYTLGTLGTFEATAVLTDPQLTSSTVYIPLKGSPVINAGVNVGLTNDYRGYRVFLAPDIGAYEYNPPAVTISGARLSGARL